MPHQRDWIDILAALSPAIAVGVAVFVASMQYYLQRKQSMQDLFDKRFQVYLSVRSYLFSNTLSSGVWDQARYEVFALETAPAKFLFGSDVNNLISEIRDSVAVASEKLDGLRLHMKEDPTFVPDLQQRLPMFRQVLLFSTKLEKTFHPYLQLHQDQSWFTRFIARMDRWINQDTTAKLAGRYGGNDPTTGP